MTEKNKIRKKKNESKRTEQNGKEQKNQNK